jgi:hypothetical protein
VQRLLLAVMLLCVACEPIEGDMFDAGVMDAGDVLVDGSADASDGGELIDKQNGGAGPSKYPTEADYARFPLSVQIGPQVPAGWQSNSGVWLYSLWSRDGVIGGGGRLGTWYRGHSGTVNGSAALTAQPWFSGSYTCHVGFLAAECFHVDGRRASLRCPETVTMEMREWRSSYNAYAPQVGYFRWDFRTQIRWAPFAHRIIAPLSAVTITGSGKQANCLYALPEYLDTWIELRSAH